MLGLRYRIFALWTGLAATVWAVAHVLLGYLAGAGWRHIHHLTGRVGLALAGAFLVAVAVAWLLRRPGPAPPGRATPACRLGAAPGLGRRPVDLEQRLQVGIRLEGDGVLGCRCPATPGATRPELTWVTVVHLAADTQLSAGGRRRPRPRSVPSSRVQRPQQDRPR
jgi:hypothetical protein